ECGFTSGTGTFDIHFNVSESMLLGLFGTIFSRNLSSKRCTLPRTFEPLGSSSRPSYNITDHVTDSNYGIVKCGLNMRNTISYVFTFFFLTDNFLRWTSHSCSPELNGIISSCLRLYGQDLCGYVHLF